VSTVGNGLGGSLIKPAEDKGKASEQALHWLIALEEKPGDPELEAALDAWLADSVDNVKAWAEAQHVWNVLGEAGDARETVGRHNRRRTGSAEMSVPAPYARQPRRRSGYLASVVLGAATVCMAVLLQHDINIWLNADYTTGTAQTREIRLEDGSVAYLGAGSAIDVSFDRATRNVRLLSGEAYFEVQPDAGRPFRVGAGDVSTTVLGTAFDVRMMADGTSVSVNHGRVAVAASAAAEQLAAPLEAGDWVHVSEGGKVERGNDMPELAGGWRSGMLVVRDRSVGEVVDVLARYYPGKIVLADAALASQRITGVYNLNEPVDALAAVVAAHGVQMRRISPWLVIVSNW